MTRASRWGAVGLVLLVTVGCSGRVSDAEGLAAALEEARPGDVIELAEGSYEGTFEVPAGVELVGMGPEQTRLVGLAGAPAVTLEPGTSPTALRDLGVVADAHWGVLAIGSGDVTLSNVDVEIPVRGVGVGVEGLSSFEATGLALHGPITEENADSIVGEPGADESAPYGMVLVNVDSARVEALELSGFASIGALSVGSTLTVDGVEVRQNLGIGLMVYGGDAELSTLVVRDTYEGVRLLPAYNVLFAGGANVQTVALESRDSAGYGVVMADASGSHSDLVSSGNATTGLWIQASSDVSVTDATLEDNGQAGVVVLDSESISLSGVSVRRTRMAQRLAEGGTAPVDFGDGIQVVDAMRGLTLEDLVLVDNERVGLLLHMASDDLSTATMGAISVEGSGEMLGAVAQGMSLPAGWDDSVERAGATVDNDVAFSGTLEVVELVGPTDFPRALEFASFGLDGLVGPTD